jgi:myo-inositol 2-dehydrogenase/D-chiro-inositol 1-dehydrogenase
MALKVGLIGAGGMGLYHALTLSRHVSGVELSGIYEPDASRVQALFKIAGNTEQFDDPLKLINSASIDAVIIASPDATHAQLVLACLAVQKPVFCEKPLAVDLKDAREILARESALSRRYVSVGFNRRFDPRHLGVKERVDSQELGPPLLWKGVHRNAEAMYNNSGAFILVNSAGHDIDSARWLLGSEVKTIFVRGLKSRPELPEDACDLLLLEMEMTSGALALAEVYVNAAYGYEVSAELVCRSGTVLTGPSDKPLVRFNNNQSVSTPSDFRAYFASAYLAEMTEWTTSLKESRVFTGASAWDGYAALAVSLAGAASLSAGVTAINAVPKPALYE